MLFRAHLAASAAAAAATMTSRFVREEWRMLRRRVREKERESRSRESRVFRYYGDGSKHGPRNACPVTAAQRGDHDHNDDDGGYDEQHDVVDHHDATRHGQQHAAVPSTTGVQSRATDGEIAQTRSCQ